MSTLLINGCSFANTWCNADQLGLQLGFDKTVNLGFSAGSNDRAFRTTVEYVLENKDVSFVILMLTFWDRMEAPWGKENVKYEGNWVTYAANGITGRLVDQLDKSDVEKKLLDRYIVDRFRYDVDEEYIDKLLINVITLTGWLKSRGIKYCVFNTCDDRYATMDNNKFDYLAKDTGVIDLKKFLSNIYIHNNGGPIPDIELEYAKEYNRKVDPRFVHYDERGGAVLNSFLNEYITNNCL